MQTVRRHSLFVFLKKHADFFSLLGLRVFPGFPQSVINYGASLLNLPLSAFVVSAILGVGLKSYLYTNVIYNAVNISDSSDLGRLEVIGPLLLIVLFVFAAKFVWFKKHQS